MVRSGGEGSGNECVERVMRGIRGFLMRPHDGRECSEEEDWLVAGGTRMGTGTGRGRVMVIGDAVL